MHLAQRPSDLTAEQQWQKLHDIYTKQIGWNVQLIDPVKTPCPTWSLPPTVA